MSLFAKLTVIKIRRSCCFKPIFSLVGNSTLLRCFQRFRKAILPKETAKAEYLRVLKNAIKCWISDCRYNVNALEGFLKEHFGNGHMFDQVKGVSGTKVAVTATRILDAFPFVFSNYNGEGARNAECGQSLSQRLWVLVKRQTGYQHVRPSDPNNEPFI